MEVKEKKIIATGRDGHTLYFTLPTKWCWKKGIKKGKKVYVVETPTSLVVFAHKGTAKEFAETFKPRKED